MRFAVGVALAMGGVFVCFESKRTGGMVEVAAQQGMVGEGRGGIAKIQILTAEDLLADKQPEYPGQYPLT